MQVRKAKVSEAQAIIGLHADTVRRINSKDYTQEQIEKWIGHRRVEITETMIAAGEYLVCVDDERLLGFGHRDGNALQGLYVSADHQGQGIGTALLNRIEEAAREEGYNELHADSTLTALGFYLRHGFVEVGRKQVKHNLEVVTIRKILSAA